jgi:glycosyltransferase involved in cell wall biosynthesis
MSDVSDQKLRVLIVGAFPQQDLGVHGGILTSCRALMASSLPERAELIVVDSSSPTVPPPPFLRRLIRAAARVVVTTRHIIWSKPDAAILFASPGSSFIEKSVMCAIARLFGVRTLMFPRGAELITQYEASRSYALLLRICFRIPTLMLCQGTVYRDFFVNRIGLPDDRCPILNNWTATPQLLKIGLSRAQRAVSTPLEILFLGWVEKEKGIFELLECTVRLSDRSDSPTFRLLIAGGGSAMAEANRYVNAHGLTDVVQFLDWIDGDEKLERLRNAELLVLPSHIEGMPNALIEAMAAGLPVVGTDVGAVGDVVSDGVTGFIVPPGDVDRLFEVLLELLGDPDLRSRMGQAGRRVAIERFSTERAVDQLLQLATADAKRIAIEGGGD